MFDVINIQHYTSPCGGLLLGAYNGQLCMCDWLTEKHHARVMSRLQRLLCAEITETADPVLREAATQLEEYFAGRRMVFNIPLLFVGTEFQKQVWQALQNIPYGTTISYADLAKHIVNPKAVRAVANTNGANAISIFVPCHRVIGIDGSLTGYAGGQEAKLYLLNMEQNTIHKNLLANV
jgi:methylated-DNA-[protein]-cysteine S-methyltransferase